MGEDERSVTKVRIETATTNDVLDCVTEAADQRFFLNRLRRGARRGRAFLAFDGSTPVGYVYLRFEEAEEPELRDLLPGTPLIQRLRVLPEHRLQGIGRELVAAVEETARRKHRHRIALGVDVHRPRPIGFYEKIGYQEWPYGRLQTFNEETGEPEYCRIFVKDLRTA